MYEWVKCRREDEGEENSECVWMDASRYDIFAITIQFAKDQCDSKRANQQNESTLSIAHTQHRSLAPIVVCAYLRLAHLFAGGRHWLRQLHLRGAVLELGRVCGLHGRQEHGEQREGKDEKGERGDEQRVLLRALRSRGRQMRTTKGMRK